MWALVQDFTSLVQASYYMFYVKLIFKCYYSTYLLLFFVKLMYFFFQISDGTIEEDFEQALAREMVSDHRRGSGDHVNAGNVTIEGMYYAQKKNIL